MKSSLAAEALAMVEALDMACYLGHLLSELLLDQPMNSSIPIDCFTDNRSLCESIRSTKQVSEKRLRLDVAGIKEMVDKKEVSSIHWIDASHQLSDCLTKRGVSCVRLLEVLHSGSLGLSLAHLL